MINAPVLWNDLRSRLGRLLFMTICFLRLNHDASLDSGLKLESGGMNRLSSTFKNVHDATNPAIAAHTAGVKVEMKNGSVVEVYVLSTCVTTRISSRTNGGR